MPTSAEQSLREEILIADETKLADVSSAVSAAGLVAIDTEFVRERTYFPELCLIQIATPDVIACIDCLSPTDLGPLFDALLRPDTTWVLHSGRQDLEVIWNLRHALPKRLIDTQIAAALLGHSPQLGLQGLLSELLKVELSKEHTRADWSKRPLAEAVLRYALDDVRYLLPAWARLRERLEALDRIAWLEDDCARLIDEPPVAELPTIFRRLKGAAGLSIPQQCAALALVQWRERRAQAADRPRRWILPDEQLVSIARAMPANRGALEKITDLPRGIVTRSADELIGAVERSDDAELRDIIDAVTIDARPDKARVAALQTALKNRAGELGIYPEVLATRRDINALAAGADAGQVFSGWRAAEVAAAIGGLKPGRA